MADESRPPLLPRRAFLIGGAAALAAVACGRTAPDAAGPTPGAGPPQLITTGIEHAVGDDRLAFAVFEAPGGSDQMRPIHYMGEASGRIQVTTPGGERLTLPLRPFPIVRGVGGDDAPDDGHEHEGADVIFVAAVPFDEGGFYQLRAEVDPGDGVRTVAGQIGVVDAGQSPTLVVGQDAVSVPTPTFDDPRQVDPVCTRSPACPMHDVSLDQAIAEGRPVVVTFATPALCTSRVCGPVVDVVEAVRARHVEAAAFIHVEVFRTLEASIDNYVEPFTAWRLHQSGEPWMFFIGSDGKIRRRLSGPVAEWEVEESLDMVRT